MSDSSGAASAGDVLGGAGVPLELTYKGRKHPVSPPTLAVLDRVEKAVAARAAAAVGELADVLPPKDFADLKADLMAKLRAKEHATGGVLWQAEFAADGGLRGLQLVLWACLEDARERAADKATLPPPVPFEQLPDVFADSPDAEAVAAVLLPDFFRAAAKRRRVPAAAVESALARTLPG